MTITTKNLQIKSSVQPDLKNELKILKYELDEIKRKLNKYKKVNAY